MATVEQSIDRIRQWAAEFEQGPPPILDRKLVHKHRQENVFVSRFERVSDDLPDDFVAQFHLDATHPFFFEHPLDHYPGLMLVEAGRQFGTAVAHELYDVQHDTAFILNGLRVDFTHFAELGKPVFVNSTVKDREYKRGALTSMLYEGHFVQNEQEIGFGAHVAGCNDWDGRGDCMAQFVDEEVVLVEHDLYEPARSFYYGPEYTQKMGAVVGFFYRQFGVRALNKRLDEVRRAGAEPVAAQSQPSGD